MKSQETKQVVEIEIDEYTYQCLIDASNRYGLPIEAIASFLFEGL